jgi:hypothetical protein
VFYVVLAKSGNIDEAITYANIHNNIMYLGCKYPEELTQKLLDYMMPK